MWEVVLSLLPIFGAAFYYFGLSAVLVSFAAIAGSLLTERMLDPRGTSALKDGSALITGMLLALCLPPGFPLWMAFLGGMVSVGIGKSIWGGLGQNIFNPALVGRAFLQSAFPAAITTWESPDGRYLEPRGSNLAMPLWKAESVDALSTATPLARMKFDHAGTDLWDLLTGNTAGSLGETCSILLILAGIYLVYRKIVNWRVPVSILLAVILPSTALYLIAPDTYPSPAFMVAAGGLLLGAVYMATDMATSPMTPKGMWIYGVSIGILVVTIRVWGGLPEGVMYAILIMNAVTPLINRATQNRVYGH
jgi:electron transport complex protein RnfD